MKRQRGFTLEELLWLLGLLAVGALMLGLFVKVFRWAWGI